MDPFSTAPATSAGALCALHPDVTAATACTRCGNFMCSTCVGGAGATTCPTCRGAAWVFPLARQDFHAMALFDVATRAFKPQWVMLTVAMLLYFVLYFFVAMVTSVVPVALGAAVGDGEVGVVLVTGFSLLLNLALGMVSALFMMGLSRICLDVYRGQIVNLGLLFSQMGQAPQLLKLWGALIPLFAVLSLPLGAAIYAESVPLGLVAGLILLVAGVVVGVAMTLMMAGFVVHPELGFVSHVVRVRELLRGKFWGAIGVMFLGGLLMMAGMLACGIGMLPASAFYQLLLVGLYLSLERDPAFERGVSGAPAGLDVIR